jgi:hypothetical protein
MLAASEIAGSDCFLPLQVIKSAESVRKIETGPTRYQLSAVAKKTEKHCVCATA